MLDTQELLLRVREHANIHYEENGWDILVECWSDDDILDVIGDAGSIEEAIVIISDTLNTIDEYRQEVQNA